MLSPRYVAASLFLAAGLAVATSSAAVPAYSSLGGPEYEESFTGETAVSTLTPDLPGPLQRLREFYGSSSTPTPIGIAGGKAVFDLATADYPVVGEEAILGVSARPSRLRPGQRVVSCGVPASGRI